MTEYLKDSVYMADGMPTVHEVKPLKSTYSEFAAYFLNMLHQMEVNQKHRSNVVLGVYENNSIKDVERNRCSSGELSM